jgi:hypothetical protein
VSPEARRRYGSSERTRRSSPVRVLLLGHTRDRAGVPAGPRHLGSTSVIVTASQDAGAGWIDRWEQGVAVRFARRCPDPLDFEREYLTVLTGRRSRRFAPIRTSPSRSTGKHCVIRPRRVGAGDVVVAIVMCGEAERAVAILVHLSHAFTYRSSGVPRRNVLGPSFRHPAAGRPRDRGYVQAARAGPRYRRRSPRWSACREAMTSPLRGSGSRGPWRSCLRCSTESEGMTGGLPVVLGGPSRGAAPDANLAARRR